MSTPESTQLPAEQQMQVPATVLAQAKTSLVEAARVFLRQAETHLKATTEKYKTVVWNDIHTVKGMEAIVRARAEFRTFRTQILKQGSEDLNAPGKAVKELLGDHIKELGELAKTEEERLDAIIKAEEQRKAAEKAQREAEERARVAGLRLRISAMTQLPVGLVGASSDAILDAREGLLAQDLSDMQELKDEAEQVRADVATTLAKMAADKMDAEEEAERQRIERERQAEAERQLAEQRAELARQQELQYRLQDIIALPVSMTGKSSWLLRDALENLKAINPVEFGNLELVVRSAITTTGMALEKMLAEAEQYEKERALADEKAESQAAEEAERQRIEREQAEQAMAEVGEVQGQEELPPAGTGELLEEPVGDLLPLLDEEPVSQGTGERTHYYDDVADAVVLQLGPDMVLPGDEAFTAPAFEVSDAKLREAVMAYFMVNEEQAHARLLQYGAEGQAS